jgi:uncharacterized glyoxalase superfamily protein PhnB
MVCIFGKVIDMNITSFYSVLATANVAATAEQFALFGFRQVFTADWYVHLQHAKNKAMNLAIVSKDHESVPRDQRVAAGGILINFEVEDVDAEYARLQAHGAEMLLPLRDEPWGQRHFIVRGPDGVAIDIIKPIPPSAEYAAAYDDSVRPQ